MPDQLYNDHTSIKPEALLALLGTLWTHYYGGKAPLLTMVRANLELQKQQKQNLAEVADGVSRLTVPLYHTENWVLLKLDRTQTCDAGLCFAKPDGLQSMPLLLNRMTDSTLMLQEGIDYQIKSKSIEFEVDPFENELISQDGDTAYLWGVNGQFDREYIQKHFGHIYGIYRQIGQSYAAYRNTINAVADCQVLGTTMARVEAVVAAYLDVPVADGREMVTGTATDDVGRFLSTTRNIYRIAEDAVLVAPEGSRPRAGTPLVNVFKIYDFHQRPDDITDVVMPAGMGGDLLKPVPAASLDVDSCVLVQLTKIDYLDDRLANLICRVLPPQTGVVFACRNYGR